VSVDDAEAVLLDERLVIRFDHVLLILRHALALLRLHLVVLADPFEVTLLQVDDCVLLRCGHHLDLFNNKKKLFHNKIYTVCIDNSIQPNI